MVRKLVIPENEDIHINLPKSYIGKVVEVLAFEVTELETESSGSKNATTEDITQFYNQFHLDLSGYKFDRDEANER